MIIFELKKSAAPRADTPDEKEWFANLSGEKGSWTLSLLREYQDVIPDLIRDLVSMASVTLLERFEKDKGALIEIFDEQFSYERQKNMLVMLRNKKVEERDRRRSVISRCRVLSPKHSRFRGGAVR